MGCIWAQVVNSRASHSSLPRQWPLGTTQKHPVTAGIVIAGIVIAGCDFKNKGTPRKTNGWNPKMKVWKMFFLFKWVIFRFHVSFRGCTPKRMVKIMVPNPRNKWMIWGGFYPYFLETPKCMISRQIITTCSRRLVTLNCGDCKGSVPQIPKKIRFRNYSHLPRWYKSLDFW